MKKLKNWGKGLIIGLIFIPIVSMNFYIIDINVILNISVFRATCRFPQTTNNLS